MDLPGRRTSSSRERSRPTTNTVVVVNTGSPVTMDWADDAPAIVQAWFGGQEMGSALADVLFGDAEPGGRLPTTFPVRLEHNPSYGNFPGEFGELRYGEGLLLGYRWYEARHLPTRFPFGHGLSYSTFELGEPTVRGRRQRGDAARAGHQHRRPPRRRGGAVLRRAAAIGDGDAPGAGAEGVRQGVARPRRVDDRRAHARRTLVRVLGPDRDHDLERDRDRTERAG